MRLKRPGLWWRRPRKGSSPDAGTVEAQEQQRQDLGLLLRRRREELGLSLRDLANETRITTPVIEALERGWRDRLPERAYLASMLPQIERRLALPGGCLDPLLPPPVLLRRGPAKAGLGRFTLGNIDVFTTWQGTVVYAAVIAFSLLAINRQQQDLPCATASVSNPCVLMWRRSAVVRTRWVQTKASRPCAPWNRFRNARLSSGLIWCGMPCRSPRGCWRLLWLSQESCSSPAVGEIGFNSQRAPARSPCS